MGVFDALVGILGFKGAVALLAFLALLIAILVLAQPISWLQDRAPYLFPTSLIRSEEGKMLSRRKLEELAEAGSLEGAITILGSTDYAPYLALEGDPELSLRVYLAHVHEDLLKIVPGKLREFFEALIRVRWDVENISHVLIEKFSGHRIFELPDEAVSLGTLRKELVKNLQDAERVEDVVTRLEKTVYSESLKEGLKDFEATQALSALIEPLKRHYNAVVMEQISSMKGDEKAVSNAVMGMQIDSRNILALLRLKKDGVPAERLEKYLVPGAELYDELPISALEGRLEETLEYLASTSAYSQVFSKAMRAYEKNKNLKEVEAVIEEEVLARAEEVSSSQVFNVGIILGYLVLKEAEINRVRIVMTSLKNELMEDEIKKLVLEAV